MFEKYGAKRELKKRVKGFTPKKKIEYLDKILSKKNILESSTRDAAYSLLGDTYFKSLREDNFPKFPEDRKGFVEAAEAYINAGEFWNAKKLIGRFRIKFGDEYSIVSKIEKDSKEGQRLYDMINKERKNRNRKKEGKLEGGLVAGIIVVGIIGGLFFLSPNVTGNIIGNSSPVSNFIGVILLIVGLIASFFLINSK